MSPKPPRDFENQLELLLMIAGRMAANDAPRQDFLDWFRRSAPGIVPTLAQQVAPGPGEIDRFLGFAGRQLYSDLPLPSNGLKPLGQERQGRNDACACGSGKKFKHCCGDGSVPLLFGEMNLLRYVLDAYTSKRLAEVAGSRADVDAVSDTARQWIEQGELTRASALLVPYFAGTGPLAVRLSPLFNQLMDVWQKQQHPTKRERLIDSLIERGDRALQSDALQRRTTIRADQGNYADAWRCFKRATACNPNDPALSFLEVTTLLSEGRAEEAQTRAAWWAAFLERQRDPQLSELIALLRRMAADPHGGMMGMAASAQPELQRLLDLLQAAPRPVVRHSLNLFTQGDPERSAQVATSALLPDAELAALERLWQGAFSQFKPMSTQVQNHATDVWDNPHVWLDLLERNPALWFSFDVLDDLVMAVDTLDWSGVVQRLLVPMAERAAEQLRLTLETHDGPVQLPWGFEDLRPVLRPIAHLAYVCKETGNEQRFMELAHWLVFELNPNDNHGLRADLSCAYVRFGRWADVLALYQHYPGDAPTLLLNAALARFATGDAPMAATLLARAAEICPVAVNMLVSRTARPVKPDSGFGIQIGGKYEAWLYVESMRKFWEQNEALDQARAALKSARSGS